MGIAVPTSGNLTRWANQGVLLLNATLTVRAHQAGSHQRKGWEEFTDAAIRALAEQREHIVFILWGVREAVATLSPREQNIIKLRYFKDKTQMEIASEIGISQAQVSRLEKAALQKLKKQL